MASPQTGNFKIGELPSRELPIYEGKFKNPQIDITLTRLTKKYQFLSNGVRLDQ